MKTIELMKKLRDYPLFTTNDVAKIVMKKSDYVKTLLYRLERQKLIYKIERGKYTIYDDAFVFASYISIPSYISLWSAVRYYNLTEQMPKTIFIMVTKQRKNLKFQNVSIEFVKTKHFFGFKRENYNGFDIFIANPEKAIIDSLLLKRVPLDEVTKAIQTNTLNISLLINYAIKTKNKCLTKRLGFILEDNGFKCSKLIRFIDLNYALLDLTRRREGKINKRWMVIDNR